MFPVFTQSNCCLGINVWAATHTAWLRANLMLYHLLSIQALHFSRVKISFHSILNLVIKYFKISK